MSDVRDRSRDSSGRYTTSSGPRSRTEGESRSLGRSLARGEGRGISLNRGLSRSVVEQQQDLRTEDVVNEHLMDMQSFKPYHEHWTARGLLYTADEEGVFYDVPPIDAVDLVAIGCTIIGVPPGQDLGGSEPGPEEPGPEPTEPPVNVDVPYVSGTGMVGGTLTCTMGNWQGEPTQYDYRWLGDGSADLGTGDAYIVASTDSGHSITCVVTATNALGSTEAPPSNAVLVP